MACGSSYFVQAFSLAQLISAKGKSLFHERAKLQSINILLDQPEERIENPNLENLHKALKAMKGRSQIKKFTFSCKNYDVGLKGIKSLSKVFKRLILLEEISLELEKCEDMNDLGLMKLGQGLGRCKTLKMLKLKIPRGNKMTYKGLDRLGKVISKIPSLERLEIVLNADQPGGNIRLWSLSRSLESLSSLQYLRLCFPYYESSLGGKFLDTIFLKDCLKKLKELRSLSLEFPRCEKIKDFWFEEICDGINELGLLEHLKLEFSF